MKMKTLAVAGALALASFAAAAANVSDTMTVSTNVEAACEVSAADLAFPTVNPLSLRSAPVMGQSNITVTCSNTTGYDVGLSGGASNDVSARTMAGPVGSSLNYALHQDSELGSNWGNTVDTDTKAATGNGDVQTHTVYGVIPAGLAQAAAAVGSYSDIVTVTVTY